VLLQQLQGWVWAPRELADLLTSSAPLLGGAGSSPTGGAGASGFQRLPLEPADGTDPLLLVMTPRLQVALCLDGPPEGRRLIARFDPEALSKALNLIHGRLLASDPGASTAPRTALEDWAPCAAKSSWGCGSGPGWGNGSPPSRRASRSNPWCTEARVGTEPPLTSPGR